MWAFLKIRVSDGTVLTTRLHAEFEVGAYQAAVSASPVARFGASFSCPFWIVPTAITTTTTSGRRGIYVPTRGVGGSEGGGSRTRFQDLNGYPSSGASGSSAGTGAAFSGTAGGRIIHVPPQRGRGTRAIYVPTIGIGGAEGDGRSSTGATVGIRRVVVYDGEGYTHR